MSELLAFLVTPTGMLLYLGFWILKILLGAWIIRCLVALLPAPVRNWLAVRWHRIRLGRLGRFSGP